MSNSYFYEISVMLYEKNSKFAKYMSCHRNNLFIRTKTKIPRFSYEP